MAENEKELMLKIPFWVIMRIATDAQGRSEKNELVNALSALAAKWVIIATDEEGKFFAEGYDEYDACANKVAYFHGTEFSVVYVLRDGSPRKNVRVEVKARL